MLDRKLARAREDYEGLKAPSRMEKELREALDMEEKRSRKTLKKLAAFLLVTFIFMGMNSNSIASLIRDMGMREDLLEDYGELMPDSLKKLEERGMIENISKKIELDSREIVVDGILVDSLGINLFVSGDKGAYESVELIDKKGRRFFPSGSGLVKEESKREVWTYYFKGDIEGDRIGLEFTNQEGKKKDLELEIDEDMRLREVKKIGLANSFRLGDLNYNLKRIYISPVNIVLEGYNENIVETGLRTIFKARKDYPALDIRLVVNGERLGPVELEYRTDMRGKSFSYRYDNSFDRLDSLELEILDGDDLVESFKLR